MPAPDSVLALCETFALHRDHYRSSAYNETELRREFLDPLFKALGWDIDNEKGYADAYKDVIHEDAIKIGGITKAPDYCFRIGGTRKFFLEAKKPSVNIKEDISPAYQLRRYAWSGKLPLSILSDFEEFAIYDCRSRPFPTDKPSKGRTFYCTFDQFGEKWDEIASIFSRESILKGSFDKYAESSKGKRGTEEVDDAFLSEIERWRELIAKNLALRNQSLTQRDLNFSVQKIIDRIIFLRICEDRGSEDYERLRKRLTGKNLYAILLEEFQRADDRYNSGLFHFTTEKDRPEAPDTLTPALSLDDKVLKDIVKNLYYPDSPYEFSVFSADILGQVYEQFLGKTIQLTPSHQAKIEEKPEVRKAGGVYYTPKYIVDYIVENTLGKILNPATTTTLSIAKAAEVKVLDPACGSGSFLIVAYQYLLDWHRDQYTLDPTTLLPDEKKTSTHSKGKSPVIYQAQGGEWKLTIAERKRILLNNIHGVDIDSQAVEVTKLSLLLKVLEGETSTTTQRDFLKERQRILPDLGNNIKCGNSLIGPDFYDQPDLPDLNEETKYRINVFDWKTGFPEAFKRKESGFDCVIGNPPYIRIQSLKENAPQEVEFYLRRYKSASSGNFDIYTCFIEKALKLLSISGKTGFIVPNKFFQAKYGAPIREQITENCSLSEIVHFGDQQVFSGATTYTCLLFLSSKQNKSFNYISAPDLLQWKIFGKAEVGMLPAPQISSSEWNFRIGQNAELLERLNSFPIKLGEIAKMFVGLQTSADTVFLFKDIRDRGQQTSIVFSKELGKEVEIENEVLRSVVRSGSIGRYSATPTALVLFPYYQDDKSCVLMPIEDVKKNFPLTHDYLLANQSLLESRERGKFSKTGWHQLYPKNLNTWQAAKILVPYMVTRLSAYRDSNELYFVNVTTGGFGLRTDGSAGSETYILALLNSRLLNFYFVNTSTPFRGGYRGANKQFLTKLPIRPIDFTSPTDVALHDKMVTLVESMLSLHEKQATEKNPNTLRMLATEITATDRRIDHLVYELYDLTEEEIALVEA